MCSPALDGSVLRLKAYEAGISTYAEDRAGEQRWRPSGLFLRVYSHGEGVQGAGKFGLVLICAFALSGAEEEDEEAEAGISLAIDGRYSQKR